MELDTKPVYQYSQLKHSLESCTYATRQAAEGRFSLRKANTNFLKRALVYRAIKALEFLTTDND